MSPPDLLEAAEHAVADTAATGGLACPQPHEMLRLEALAEAVVLACPSAQHVFHEDYLGRAMLLIDLPSRGGEPVCLVVAPAAMNRFDLARVTEEDMFPLGHGLDRSGVLERLRAASR